MISEERLLEFSRAMADSVRSGLSHGDTLRSLAPHSIHGRALLAAASRMEKGGTLHESLGAQNLFPPLFIALIRAGEESGKIDAFLDRYSSWLDIRLDFKRRLARAFVYPGFACALAAALFVLFSAKAAPILFQPIVDAGGALPPSAARTIRVGEFLLARWPLILGGLFAVVLLLRAFFRSGLGRKLGAIAGHWLPGFRFVGEEARYYRIASTLELLLAAGLRPRQIMELLSQSFEDDPVTHRRFSRGAVMLSQGKSFSESIGNCLPAPDRPRVAVAEKAGRLDETFGKIAALHQAQHMHRLKLTATAFQISTTVALAPVCLGLILWVLWPTFSLLSGGFKNLIPGAESAAIQSPEIGAAAPSGPVSRTQFESPAAANFNEASARQVAKFMQAHSPNLKPVPKPKLKPMPSIKGSSFKKFDPTPIQSSLNL